MIDSLAEFYTRYNNGRPATKSDVQDVVSRAVTANRLSTDRAKNPKGDVRIKGISNLQDSLKETNKSLLDLRVTSTNSMRSLSKQVMLTGRDTNQELRELRKTLQKQQATINRENAIDRQHEAQKQQQHLRNTKRVRDVYLDDKARSLRSHAALIRSMSMPRDARGRWMKQEGNSLQNGGQGGASLGSALTDVLIGGALWKGVKTFGGALLRGVTNIVSPVVRAIPTLTAKIAPYAANAATGAARGLGALALSPFGAGLGATALGEYAGDAIHKEDMRLPEKGEDTLTHKFARFGDTVNDALGHIGLGSHVDHGNKQAEADAARYAEIDRKKSEVETKDSTATLGSTYADTISSLAGTAMGWIEDKAVATTKSLLDIFKSVKQIENEKDEEDKKVKVLDPVKRTTPAKPLGPTNTGTGPGGLDDGSSPVSPSPSGSGTPGGRSPGGATPGGGPAPVSPDTDKPVSPTGAFKPTTPTATPDPALGASLDSRGKPKPFNPSDSTPETPANKKSLSDLDPALKLGKQSKPPQAATPSVAPLKAATPQASGKQDSGGGDSGGDGAASAPKPSAGKVAPAASAPDQSSVKPTVSPDDTPAPSKATISVVPGATTPGAPSAISVKLDPINPPSAPHSVKQNIGDEVEDLRRKVRERGGVPNDDKPTYALDAAPAIPEARPEDAVPSRSLEELRKLVKERGGVPNEDTPVTTQPTVNDYDSGAVSPVNTEPTPPASNDHTELESSPPDNASTQAMSEPYISDVPQQITDPALRKIQSHDNA